MSGLQQQLGRLVRESNQMSVFCRENISRKVIIAKDEDVAGHPSYLVVDYLHGIFPVTSGTVVVPYYPCVNDMVFVQGDDEDTTWRARVIALNIRRHTVTGRFFKKRDGDNLWVPEGTRDQLIMFDSILGIAAGDWVIQFTTWRDVSLVVVISFIRVHHLHHTNYPQYK